MKRLFSIAVLAFVITHISISTSSAEPPNGIKISPKQILLDTGGGGGEGPNLPGTKWWFGITAGGNPFMFWTWSPN